MKKVKVLADEVSINNPVPGINLKRNCLINYGFSKNNAKYRIRRKFKKRMGRGRYHLKC